MLLSLVSFVYYFVREQSEIFLSQENLLVWTAHVDALAYVVHLIVAGILSVDLRTLGSFVVAKFCAKPITLTLVQRNDLSSRAYLGFYVVLHIDIIATGSESVN